jgi:protein-S-isoprenylcysteine O-methyltransferase Ste14
MTIYGWLIFALWLALVAYWSLATAAAMRSTGSRWLWWREIAIRLGFFALVVLVLQVAVPGRVLPRAGPYAVNSSMLTGLIGFVCTAFGTGLAILARACLGRSGAVPASGRRTPELVTTGPYALVRHPLYSGMLFAMLGSAIGQSVFWLLPLVVYGPYFILGARREEKRLIEQFPDRYRAYMKRTKMLVPFVL